MDKSVLDIYTDYLISSFGQTGGGGLSALLGGTLSHDRISRFLNAQTASSADLWQLVKPLACQIQRDDGVLIIDDSVEEKLYSDESDLICWHWDHTVNRSVKGINLLTCLYYSQQVALPVAFELVKKPDFVTHKKTGKLKRTAKKTKNELDFQVGSNLVDWPLFLEGFEDGFGFEFGRVSLSHGVLSLTYFRRFLCPDSPDHYTLPPVVETAFAGAK